MANCCNYTEECNELVTLGYMAKISLGHCTTVSSHAPSSTCDCSAEGSAYTPTFSEINGGTYANVRTLNDSDPGNDVDGFSATSSVSFDASCCSASSGESNVKRNDLKFGYTKLSGATVREINPDECFIYDESSSSYSATYWAYLTRVYQRYEITCDGESDPQDKSSNEEEIAEQVIHKNYSSIQSSSCSASCEVTYSPPSGFVGSAITISRCTDEVSKTLSGFNYSSYTASIVIEKEDEIECDGGDVVSAFTRSKCDDIQIIDSYLYHGDYPDDPQYREEGLSSAATSSSTEGVITYQIIYNIPKNANNYTDSKIALVVQIGNKSGTITCELNRKACKIIPDVDNDTECGIFPSIVDDWSKLNSIIYKGYTCRN